MNAERWQQIKTILETALGKDPGSLEQYLDKACADDSELRSEINSLIAMQEQAKNVSEIKAVNIIGKSFVKGITETNLTNSDENSEDILDSEIKIGDIHKSIIGRALGDFLVKEKLGEGGFGVVYKATQLTLEREVVIKVLHTRHSKNRNIIERFKREALLASRFEHPYCAHIYSFGAETDGLLWIAMEFVQGTPLNELLKAKGKLSLEKFVLLLNKICEVVHTAHEAGIIHRDLKPANVMVISRAGRLFPKLLDFGIAKGLNQNINLIDKSLSNFSVTENNNNFIEDNSNLTSDKLQVVTDNLNYLKSNFIEQEKETDANKPEATNPKAILSNTKAEWFQTQGFIGSPPYMSPEQWENGANVDARSDIYSLGVLAYQVIVGDLPFNEKGYQLYKAHASKPVPLLKEGFPIRLNEVLKKALAKKPEDRYQTALEFAKEFRDAADFNEQTVNLPQLDEILKEDLLANAPKPLADTTASLLASHNAYQFRDRVLLVFSVLIRYIGVLTLASYTSIANRVQDNELVNKSITTLCHKGLSESEWIELARELCRPFAKKRDAFAIAELVSLFFTDNSELLSPVNETFNNLLQLREKILFTMSVTEENLVDFLAEFVLKLTVLLKATCWLSDYYLVLPKGKQATKWMGRTGIAKDLGVISIKASILANDKATLVDAKGHFVLSLWPLIEIVEPTLGASQEVFLLEGKGYNGTKLVSFPYGFEIETEGSLEWLKEHFFTDEEKSHSELLLETSPYLGLATFSPEDSVLFFGREKETERFLNRLRLQPLLVVVGPSGAGKSSFIQAGVIARLIKNWKILTLRPGLSPLATLSTKLSTLGFEITDLKASLQKDISFLAKTLRRFAINNNNIILLVVDQFEEIFTLCLDKEEQKLYVDAIVSLVCLEEDSIKVILTIRDDFLVRAKELDGLRDKLNQNLEILTTPDSTQLLRILVLPARRIGYEFEDNQLAIEIVNSLAGQTSALPLLAFTAAKLWEQRDHQFKQLRRKSYEIMGGVGGALAKHAEEALMQMTQAEQHLVREAFRHLVTSQGTRAILTRLELLQLLGKISDGERVIEKLILARLLVATEGEKGLDRIEIVHEALLNTWPRLVKWQQEDIEGARLRDQLREAARQWQDRGQPKGLLWRDEILAELQLWRSRYIGKLTEIEIAFSNASFAEAAQSQQRKRLLYSSIFIVLLVALVTAFWINYQINNQLVKSYLEQGRNELFNSRPMQAAVYFNEVYKENRDNIPLKMLLGQAMKSVDATQIASFEIPGGVISSSFSPDDKRVLIAGGTTVKVLDIASGKQLLLIDKDLSVNHADFSHDGKLIATADYNQNNIKIWDSFTGNLLRTIDSTGKFTFSYDDKRIACANGKMAQIFDVESGKLLLSLSHPINFTSIAFSPDGSRVVTSNNKTAKVWDLVNGELLLSIEGHTSFIYFSTFSPDGTKIVTASTDKTAKIWDATSGKLLASLEGHKSDVTGIDFSKDGKLIATSSIDKTVKIWDATNNRMLASLALHIGYIWSVNFNKDATQVVTASYDGTAKILDVSKLRVTDSEITRYSTRATIAEYSKDGRYILTGGDEINLFDATSKKLLRTIKLSNKNVGDLTVARFSPDSKHIVTASFNESPINTSSNLDNNAKVWEVETGKLMLTLSGHKSNIKSVAFSKDGKRIVTAGDDKTAKVWNALTGALELTLIGHNGIIRSAEFSPNGREIVTAGEGNSAKVWDATNGKLLRLLTGHSMELIYAIFSPDGKRIITTSIDATAKIMDAITGQVLFSIDGHSGDVRYCCFSPDGSFIATGSGDGTAKIWDATNGKLLLSLEGHGTWVNMVDFSLDQRYLITASSDTTVKIWGLPQETRTSREIAKVIEQRVPFRFDRGQLIPITNKPISK